MEEDCAIFSSAKVREMCTGCCLPFGCLFISTALSVSCRSACLPGSLSVLNSDLASLNTNPR